MFLCIWFDCDLDSVITKKCIKNSIINIFPNIIKDGKWWLDQILHQWKSSFNLNLFYFHYRDQKKWVFSKYFPTLLPLSYEVTADTLTVTVLYYLYETMRTHIYLNFMLCNVLQTIKLVFILQSWGGFNIFSFDIQWIQM